MDITMSGAGDGLDMLAVYVRNDQARRIVAGFAAEMPSLSDLWAQLDQALADVPLLGAVVARLTAELAGARPEKAGGDHDGA
jgi:hypothetical protein